jgi:hypothetical protein
VPELLCCNLVRLRFRILSRLVRALALALASVGPTLSTDNRAQLGPAVFGRDVNRAFSILRAVYPLGRQLNWLLRIAPSPAALATPGFRPLRVPYDTLSLKAHFFSHRSSYFFILALRVRIHHAHSIRRAALKATSRMRRRTTVFFTFIIGSHFYRASWFVSSPAYFLAVQSSSMRLATKIKTRALSSVMHPNS